ncbi:MAG: hypothetical protein OXU62_12465 [Gammaproteobacteria bacterium]|nr:hypothetical protein [Gammaproteobacteria bacterium]
MQRFADESAVQNHAGDFDGADGCGDGDGGGDDGDGGGDGDSDGDGGDGGDGDGDDAGRRGARPGSARRPWTPWPPAQPRPGKRAFTAVGLL